MFLQRKPSWIVVVVHPQPDLKVCSSVNWKVLSSRFDSLITNIAVCESLSLKDLLSSYKLYKLVSTTEEGGRNGRWSGEEKEGKWRCLYFWLWFWFIFSLMAFKLAATLSLEFRVMKIRDSGSLVKVEKTPEIPDVWMRSLESGLEISRQCLLCIWRVSKLKRLIPENLQSGVQGLGLENFARVPL